jgi:CubicO group peptidase (beta-lactamase class C family)
MANDRAPYAPASTSRTAPAPGDSGGPTSNPVTVPATEPVRLWHLLTHTAGLTYGFHHANPVDEAYRAAGFEWVAPEGRDLAACCDAWAGLPLLFEPGSR